MLFSCHFIGDVMLLFLSKALKICFLVKSEWQIHVDWNWNIKAIEIYFAFIVHAIWNDYYYFYAPCSWSVFYWGTTWNVWHLMLCVLLIFESDKFIFFKYLQNYVHIHIPFKVQSIKKIIVETNHSRKMSFIAKKKHKILKWEAVSKL